MSSSDRLGRCLAGLVSVLLLTAFTLTEAASAASGSERPGAALLTQVESGQRSCDQLSPGDFQQMGRYDMGRIMGAGASYTAMNAQLQATVGAPNEQLAYGFMGKRLSGCAAGNGPLSFGTMMSMMGTSEMGASYGSEYPNSEYGASMMGGRSGTSGASAAAIAVIVFGGLLAVAFIVWLATRRTARRPMTPGA